MTRVPKTPPLASAVSALLALVACQQSVDDLRVWQPSDHRNTSNQAAQAQQSDGQPEAQAPPGLDPVTLRTWAAQCSICHGQIGRGDGPQSTLFKPTDLSDPAWQSQVTDQQIATSILKGKGQMPAFQLPQVTVDNLVELVRLFNRDRAPSGPSEPGAGQSNAHGAGQDRPAAARPTPHPGSEPRPATPRQPADAPASPYPPR